MPSAIIDRPKITRAVYQSLKRYILRERERKKQEQEHDEAMERMRKEQEARRKKDEANSLTLEQTKEQISHTERQLEILKQEKHQLFDRLKKVIHQEELRKMEIKENERKQYSQQVMPPHLHGVRGHTVPASVNSRGGAGVVMAPMRSQTKYMGNAPPQPQGGIKRHRSPSPTPIYGGGSAPKYHAANPVKQEYVKQEYVKQEYVKQEYANTPQKSYPQSYGGHAYPPKQNQVSSSSPAPVAKYGGHAKASGSGPPPVERGPATGSSQPSGVPPGQSAFQSYTNQHYPQHPSQQKALPEGYHGAPGYNIPRAMQQNYLQNSPSRAATNINLQQQLEHANSKSGFTDDRVKSLHQMDALTAHIFAPRTSGTPPTQGGPVSSGTSTQYQQQQVAYSGSSSTPSRHAHPYQDRRYY